MRFYVKYEGSTTIVRFQNSKQFLEQLERQIAEAERNGDVWFSVTIDATSGQEPKSVGDEIREFMQKKKRERDAKLDVPQEVICTDATCVSGRCLCPACIGKRLRVE